MTVSSEPEAALRAPSRGRSRAGSRLSALLGGLVVVSVTFLGLMAITFLIGRVMPIDPVLAVVGDRASRKTLRRAAARARARPAAHRAVRALCGQRAARRSRHVGHHRRPGGRGHRSASSPRPSSSRPSAILIGVALGRAPGRAGGRTGRGRGPTRRSACWAWSATRAGLLARRSSALRVLRQARLGRRPPGRHRHRLRRHRAPCGPASSSSMRARRASGRSSATRSRHLVLPAARCSASSASPTSRA